MKPINRSIAFLGLGLLLTLTGCVKLWQENIDIRTYMVEVDREGDAVAEPLADKLWVEFVNVLPPFNVRNMVLRQSDVEFSTSYYTELLMSPSENFRNEVFGWMSGSGLFDEVSIVNRVGRSHSLVTTVMEFYGDETTHEAVLRIKATLLDEKTAGNRVLLSKDYSRRIKLATSDVEGLIRGYNAALSEIMVDLESDIEASLK